MSKSEAKKEIVTELDGNANPAGGSNADQQAENDNLTQIPVVEIKGLCKKYSNKAD